MKKTLVLIMVCTMLITLTASAVIPSKPKKMDYPEPEQAMVDKVIALKKAKQYKYSFKAVNYGNAVCEIQILDDNYLEVYYPETKQRFFYYYKFTGDYYDSSLNNKRIGIFGYVKSFEDDSIKEIVFKNNSHGGYKFKSLHDEMKNDKKYQTGAITFNAFPDKKMPETSYFLYYFEEKDKKSTSVTDEVGNKKDLAGTIYWSLAD